MNTRLNNNIIKKKGTGSNAMTSRERYFSLSRVPSYLSFKIISDKREGQVVTSVWSFVIYICNETCAHVDGRICKVSSACKRCWDQREKAECLKQLKANVKSLVSRFFFCAEWEKEIKLTISFCIHTYRVYVNIWYSVSLILPFDNDHIGTIIFRIE